MAFDTASYIESFAPFFKAKRRLSEAKQAKFFCAAVYNLHLDEEDGLIQERVETLSEMIERATDKGWNINVLHPSTGLSVVHQFANLVRYQGSAEILHCLVDHGADLELQTRQGSTFLMLVPQSFKQAFSDFLSEYEQQHLQQHLPQASSPTKLVRL